MTREETHNKLRELRDRAARQPISYKPLFVEAIDIAADLLHELCELDVGMPTRINQEAIKRMRHALQMVLDANSEDPHIPPIALATIETALRS